MVVALSFAAVLGNVVFEAGQQAHFQERVKTLEEQENKMLAELNHLKSETADAQVDFIIVAKVPRRNEGQINDAIVLTFTAIGNGHAEIPGLPPHLCSGDQQQ